MNDYFSFPSLKNDNDVTGGALLTPAEMEGYMSPLDSPVVSTLSSRLEEAASLPIRAQDDAESQEAEPMPAGADAAASVRSPSAFATVLNQDFEPPPPAQERFLHGGPPLSELEAPSVTIPTTERKNRPVASAEWRAFTDEEEDRLKAAWRKLQEKLKTEKSWPALTPQAEKTTVKGKDGTRRVAEEGEVEEDHLVPVGLDNLFTVDLQQKILAPAFWTGTPVRVILSHWFYAPPSISEKDASLPSHHLKPYPVDPALSASLDRAFGRIRPWEPAYGDELASALKGGAEAQLKLAVPLAVENEAETEGKRDLGIEVIFEGRDRGRVYSRGMVGSMSKSFFSSGKSLGGGQVVVRGWDALKAYVKEKAPKKNADSSSTPTRPRTPVRGGNTSAPASPAPRSRTTSAVSNPGSEIKRSESPGLFASLRNRLVGVPAPPSESAGEASEGLSARPSLEGMSDLPNETQAALERDPRNEDGSKIGAVSELVLLVHGIGQGLATTYDSFAFHYAANDFRSACTTLSTSETLSPLLKGKRMQTIPVLWRTDLDFDEIDDAEETAEEHLANRFTLKDIEVSNSVPFLRQVVSGLVLDVPFYLTPVHKTKMLRSVVKEANRIYRLFCKRNPSFSGKVSIVAHSLGSCLVADILSSQPTFVKDLDKPSIRGKHDPNLTFCFDTRAVFLVGSPLAFFLHLGKGQLIARAGRERTKNVGKDIALDRAGRLGCLACDTVYNVYHETDPVVFALNATVDARYAKLIKPVPIPSSNQTLLQNLSDAYHRVSRIFDFSYLWSSSEAKPTGEQAKEQAEKQVEEKKVKVDDKVAAAKIRRPGAMKRMPSERPKYGMGKDEFEWVGRAEKRFKALNPSGTCDYVLPAEGLNQYVDALYAHQGYWTDRRFCTFILTQLFAEEDDLIKAGVEELGIEEEDETAA